jgi:hypothetical protein
MSLYVPLSKGTHLWRAVDQHGVVLDVLVRDGRDDREQEALPVARRRPGRLRARCPAPEPTRQEGGQAPAAQAPEEAGPEGVPGERWILISLWKTAWPNSSSCPSGFERLMKHRISVTNEGKLVVTIKLRRA